MPFYYHRCCTLHVENAIKKSLSALYFSLVVSAFRVVPSERVFDFRYSMLVCTVFIYSIIVQDTDCLAVALHITPGPSWYRESSNEAQRTEAEENLAT